MTPEILMFGVRLLIAVTLYAFLGVIVWLQWRQLRASGSPSERYPAAHLHVLNGMAAGEEYPLTQTVDVGRAVGNAVRLQDEAVSAQHARISYQGGQWWVEDFASRNGTHVNGVRVQEPLVVTYGDEIRFGRTIFSLERGTGSGARAGGGPRTVQIGDNEDDGDEGQEAATR